MITRRIFPFEDAHGPPILAEPGLGGGLSPARLQTSAGFPVTSFNYRETLEIYIWSDSRIQTSRHLNEELKTSDTQQGGVISLFRGTALNCKTTGRFLTENTSVMVTAVPVNMQNRGTFNARCALGGPIAADW